METTPSHRQKIDRLEAERRQLEDRIRRLKRAAQTAERKRLTRAKIILGALVVRDHPLLRQLMAQASPQDADLLRSVFPQAAKEARTAAASHQQTATHAHRTSELPERFEERRSLISRKWI